jgi:hypothetical protein
VTRPAPHEPASATVERNHDEHPPDRRLRPAVGLPLGRAGRPGRLGGLAVLPPLRRAERVRPAAGRRRRPSLDPAGRGVRGHPSVPGPDHGAGDHLHHRDRGRRADRRPGRGPQRPRPRPRRRLPRRAGAVGPGCPGGRRATASARFTLRAGESAGFALAGPLAAGDRVEGWTATGRRSAPPSASAAGANGPAPTPRPSAPTTWTPAA